LRNCQSPRPSAPRGSGSCSASYSPPCLGWSMQVRAGLAQVEERDLSALIPLAMLGGRLPARRIVEGTDLALCLRDGFGQIRAPGVAHSVDSGAELLHCLVQRAAGGGLEINHR